MIRHLLVVGAAVLVVAGGRGTVQAYCPNPPPWNLFWEPESAPTTIPVYINTNLVNICQPYGGLSNCANFDDVRRTIQVALDEYNDSAAADVRFRYAGTTSSAEYTIIPGAVHVYRIANWPYGNGVGGRGEPLDTDSNGYSDACRVEINPSTTSTGFEYAGMDEGPVTGIYSVMVHELGHCLGFGHTDSYCGLSSQSVMMDGARHKDHLFQFDIDQLQDIYGQRAETARSKKSTNQGYTWLTGPNGPTSYSRSRYSVSSNSFLYTYTSVPHLSTERIRFMRNVGTTWEFLGDLPSVNKTPYHTGTATPEFSFETLVAYAGNYDDDTGLTDIMRVTSTDGGSTWAAPVQASLASDRTMTFGVAATYDPDSDAYIFLWRRTKNESTPVIRGEVVQGAYHPGSGGTVRNNTLVWPVTPDPTVLTSADTPSIACGPSSIVGDENCLMAWTTREWDHFFYWVQGHVNCIPGIPGLECYFVFDEADVYANPTVVYGQPSVTYTTNATWPWVIAYHQGYKYAYTMRKGVTGDWTTWRSNYTYGYTVSPAVGSKINFCFGCNPDPPEVHLEWHASH